MSREPDDEAPDEGEVPVATIRIERFMTLTGDLVDYVKAENDDGQPMELATALGMMRLAEDTLIRERMGEAE